jgi:hypothetical protein
MNCAGSIIAANYVVNVAPKDGSVIDGLQREIALVQLMGEAQARYKAEEIQELVSEIAKVPSDKLATLSGHFKFQGKVEKVVLKIITHAGKVVATKRGGHRIVIDWEGKNRNADVSGSRTTVTLNGTKVKRNAIKVGMNCTFHYYGDRTQAKEIVCAN